MLQHVYRRSYILQQQCGFHANNLIKAGMQCVWKQGLGLCEEVNMHDTDSWTSNARFQNIQVHVHVWFRHDLLRYSVSCNTL